MVLALAVALLSSPARADVPPPDDYEEICTADIQARPGETCVICTARHGDTTCDTTWTAQGYHRRCSQWGATVRNELWCDGSPPLVDQPTMNSAPANTETVMIGAIAGVACCGLGVAVLAVGGVLVLRKKKA